MSFVATARRAVFRASLRNQSVLRAGGRRMNSSTPHAEHKPKSDMPWMIGSALIFGPAFLYLVSPSSRKSTHAHDSHGDHKTAKTPDAEAVKEEQPAQTTTAPKSEPTTESKSDHVVMRDDEGTEADVTGSVQAAEDNDVPKADGTSDTSQQPSDASENTSEVPKGRSKEESGNDSSGTFQQEGDRPRPTNMTDARRATAEDKPPKKVAEEGS